MLGQTVTPFKTVVTNTNACGTIDVQLNITGANPIQRPLEVVLIIDISGSMSNTITGDTSSSMDNAKDAATDFINTFFNGINNPTGLNRLGIVTYSNTATIRQGLTLTAGKPGLLSIINGLIPGGSTNIQDGIVKGDEVLSAGTFNCVTSRSLILLTDGVANLTGLGGSSCSSGTSGTCIQSAITAATEAKTNIISGITYNNQIFSIGLFGGISGTDQTNATFCLNSIQSGGAFFTESGANLTGIYAQVFSHLSWVAQQLTATSFETETISLNFDIVPGSITVSKGIFTQTGQVISWNFDFLNVETIFLKYRLTPKVNVCSSQNVSTSRLDYQNSACVTTFQNITTPTYCVPCPPTITNGTISSCYPTVALAEAAAIAATSSSNNCAASLTITASTVGTCSAVITVLVTNGCYSNSTTYNTKIDNTIPVLSGQGTAATISCPATPSFTAPNATDNCSGTPIITFTDNTITGSCAGNYTVTRTWIATDSCGNVSLPVSQTIIIEDTTAPVISSLPSPTTLNYSSILSFQQAVTTDECSNVNLIFVDTPTTPNCNGSYSITRTWTASDECNNSSTASQVININPAHFLANDDTGTTINGSIGGTAFTNILINDTLDGVYITNPALVTITFVSSTNAGVTLSGNDVIVAAGTPDGNYTLTYQICGTSATCSCDTAIVTVTVGVIGIVGIDAVNDTYNVNCTNVGLIGSIISNDILNNISVSISEINLSILSGSYPNLNIDTNGNISLTSAGGCGDYVFTYKICEVLNPTNCDTATITVSISDTTAPTFDQITPTEISVSCDAIPPATVLTATDNCSIATVAMTEATTPGICPSTYTLIRTWTATDLCGNPASVSQTIHVSDTTGTYIIGDFQIKIETTCDAIPPKPELVFGDNCSTVGVPVYTSVSSEVVANVYTITRTWTVTDACGNISTFIQYVFVTQTTDITEVLARSCTSAQFDTIDLNTLLPDGTPSGKTWTNVNDVGGLTGTVFNAWQIPEGLYTFSYLITEGICPRSIDIKMTVDNTCFVEDCQNIIVHNAFTPNNDALNLNEFFYIENIEQDCHLPNNVEIYNRWGVLVYETVNYDNSSKKFVGISEGRATVNKSAELPSGTYFYIIKYSTSTETSATKDGYLYLSR